MASTFPAKSQPLHNFTLPHLKWNKDGHSGGGHHQRRRSVKSPSRRPNPNTSSASPVRQSPLRDFVSATPPRHQSPLSESPALPLPCESSIRRDYLGKHSSTQGEFSVPFPVREWMKRSTIGGDPPLHLRRHGLASESEALGKDEGDLVVYQKLYSKALKLGNTRSRVSSTNPERGSQKFETKSKAKEVDVAGIKRSKKILIKIPYKSNKSVEENPPEEPLKIVNKEEADETDEVREEGKINNNTDEETKIWNLRPRKPIRTSLSVNGGLVKNNGSAMPEKNKGQSPSRNLSNKSGENGGSCGGGGQKKGSEKKEKRKLSVFLSLSKEEIEEDIFALTGSKPSRRPKKRAKSIQKQVDSLFPGSWLVSISADSYKVSEK